MPFIPTGNKDLCCLATYISVVVLRGKGHQDSLVKILASPAFRVRLVYLTLLNPHFWALLLRSVKGQLRSVTTQMHY